MTRERSERPNLAVVAIGLSAGGTSALREFFSGVDDIASVSFVIAPHLPEGDAASAHQALASFTRLPVADLTDGDVLQGGRVYLVPPHGLVDFDRGRVRLNAARALDERLGTIDHLFQAIAREFTARAIAVVLSGEADDGTAGVGAVTAAGGLALAQTPDSAEHAAMPTHAIGTGSIDSVLDPAEMWRAIRTFVTAGRGGPDIRGQISTSLTRICEILQARTKHDFRNYKTSTLVRRILRRMQVLQLISVDDYVLRLEDTAGEAETLFKDILINVTAFFRDAEAFAALKTEALRPLVERAPPGQRLRVWVPGCSTGEEVYTIAMLLKEVMEETGRTLDVQILATDIDEAALVVARRGSYPKHAVERISDARLERFFTRHAKRFHVLKDLREMCLFSTHNLIADPPFAHLDLISCRNVMIYLGASLQAKLFPLFHYALRPNGYLFLGNSEALGAHRDLFELVDPRHRLSQRKPSAVALPNLRTPVHRGIAPEREDDPLGEAGLARVGQTLALDEMPLSYAIVNEDGHVLSASAGVHKYLRVGEGSFENKILKLVAPGLRSGLRGAFATARQSKRKVVNDACTVHDGDRVERVAIVVRPMPKVGDVGDLYWIAFQSLGRLPARGERRTTEDDGALLDQLERELEHARQELDRTVQDLEASNEELKSSNEELLSMNEELQAANEELETSKEQVQSSNEALRRANLDLENLLASTQIATLFLDDQYRIRNFTPAVRHIYNIQASDVGRHLSDFSCRASLMPAYPPLPLQEASLPPDAEVTLPDGRVFSRRILPYRTPTRPPDGIVVSFIDVTDVKTSEGRFFTLANTVPVITWTADRRGVVEYFNARWFEFTGRRPGDFGWEGAIHADDIEGLRQSWADAIADGCDLRVEFRLRRHDGVYRWHASTGAATKAPDGVVNAWFGTCVDIHDRRAKVDVLEESGRSLRTIVEAIPQYVWRADPDGAADYASERFKEYVGLSEADLLGWGWLNLIHPEDRARVARAWGEARADGRAVSIDFRIQRPGDGGEPRWVRSQGNPYFNSAGTLEKYYGTWTDVHDHYVAEAARAESEERFRIMADTAPVLSFISDGTKGATWFNRGWLEWTGETLASQLGYGWAARLHPDDHESCMEAYAKAFDRRAPIHLEVRLRDAAGHFRWLSLRAVPRFTADDRFEGFIWGAMDINEQKRAADAVRSSEAHFRTLVDHSPALMWITDRDAKCTYLSKRWYDVTGRTPEQDLGFGWVENVHPDDRAAAKDAFFTALEARGPISIRYRLRQRDGTYRVSMDTGLPLISDDKEFLGYIGTVIDIQDLVDTQASLASLNDRFERSTAATDLGVWYCDLPFDQLIWNKEVKRHFFVPEDHDVTIDDFYAHIHPDDRARVRAAIDHSIENHASYDVRMRTIDPARPDRSKHIRAIGWTDYDAEGRPIRFDGITLDVSAEHARAEELEQARHAAEAASESKTRFLANMSHEIRTPLSAIVGYGELLSSRVTPDTEVGEFVGRITRNSGQLSRLIDELLDLSKIEADKLEVERKAIDVDLVLENVFSAMMLHAEQKGLTLDLVWTTPRPGRVLTDPVRLSQILTNVIGNAVKFTDRGSVTLEATAENGRLTFCVSDTGIGLSDEEQRRLFQPFSQADQSVARRFGGTGLGLSLSRRLARLLDGDLTLVRSRPGEGSAFKIDVAAPAAPEAPKADEARATTNVKPLAGIKLLLVDDSPDNRTIARIFLETAGAQVYEAPDGGTGVTRAFEHDVDLVLMDIQMPVMDGYQAFRNLRERGFEKPIVALTAHALREERDRCLAAGFAAYVTKPIKRALLIETLREVLAL